jgi:hypothetical protein
MCKFTQHSLRMNTFQRRCLIWGFGSNRLSGWIQGNTHGSAAFVNQEAQLSLSGFQLTYQRTVVETRHGETAMLYNKKPGRFALYVSWR